MTSEYKGPAYKKGRSLADSRKRKFQRGMTGHRSSDKKLEEPAIKRAQKINKDSLIGKNPANSSTLKNDEFSQDIDHTKDYQTVFAQNAHQHKFDKASQAMRSKENKDEQFDSEVKETDPSFAYEIPFLRKNDYQRVRMEINDQKNYNDSLFTREAETIKKESQTIEARLANIDHSLKAVQRMQDGYQEKWSKRQVDRQLLKRLIKDKQSFLLFAKEDNE
ncbi:hypothetical protein [Facklamia miroungae]|uniref:Uncharacterized protein n=1 Tax=Facklamia miroungae TaxID=120956 RepID=A0A1G7TKU5_9LACT|nr:hypothetical protein [Facklamia miroungae]NKZ29794.1 hypothetical protein [Facklamia miroungae]SDG35953.1 hypothetical protein SAMN05421791_10660 [Facklamia miroungae]